MALGFGQHPLFMGMKLLLPGQNELSESPNGQAGWCTPRLMWHDKHFVSLLLSRHPEEVGGEKKEANKLGETCHEEGMLLPRDCKSASLPNTRPSEATTQAALTFTVILERICGFGAEMHLSTGSLKKKKNTFKTAKTAAHYTRVWTVCTKEPEDI